QPARRRGRDRRRPARRYLGARPRRRDPRHPPRRPPQRPLRAHARLAGLSMLFRAATADDLAAILALLVDDDLGKLREDVGPPLNPRYLAAFEAIECDPNQLLAVADQDGEVVGCLQITFI